MIARRVDLAAIFPDDEAIVRLVGALMLEPPDEAAVGRRDMGLEILARITGTADVRPPAVPA